MEKKKLYAGPVNVTGRKVTADRTAVYDKMLDYRRGGWVLIYEPYDGITKGLDVNALVYELMIVAGCDMIETGKVLYAGDWTAAELAGKAGFLHLFTENGNPEWEDYKRIRIKTKDFECSFDASVLFEQMAEWEGVAGIAAAKCYRFRCEGREMPKDTVLKPYKRCRGYKPTTISMVMTERRINEKFEVLGKLYEALSSDGIRKAMSVVAAARCFENKGYEWRDMAKRAMLWKLWKDYGGCERLHRREAWLTEEMKRTKDGKRYQELKKEADGIRGRYAALSSPVPFSELDFNGGPECYQVVDDAYALELRAHFMNMMDAAPRPEWPERGDVVRIKGAEKMKKKLQGKHLVDSLQPRLSAYGDRIVWTVAVTVGKFDCEYFLPGQLEPVEDGGPRKKSKKAAQNGKDVKVKDTSVADQLRQALLARLSA